MRKELLSLSIIIAMASAPCLSFADSNYNVITPAIQTIPASSNSYQSQYPLPVNSYQTQGYNYNNYGYGNYNNGQLQGNVVMVPANTSFPATSMTSISSETAKLGDNVSFYLGSDFYYGNKLIASAGSKVNGTVIKAKKGGLGNRNGQLQVRFTNIITPTGQMIPISASIQTNDGTGILKAGTAKDVSKEYAKDAAIGAEVTGAVVGCAICGIADFGIGILKLDDGLTAGFGTDGVTVGFGAWGFGAGFCGACCWGFGAGFCTWGFTAGCGLTCGFGFCAAGFFGAGDEGFFAGAFGAAVWGKETGRLGSCFPPAWEFLSALFFVFLFIGGASFSTSTKSISLGFNSGLLNKLKSIPKNFSTIEKSNNIRIIAGCKMKAQTKAFSKEISSFSFLITAGISYTGALFLIFFGFILSSFFITDIPKFPFASYFIKKTMIKQIAYLPTNMEY